MNPAPHPYTALTPDSVMDALTGLGLWPDGRLMALGSYENRVYRAQLDEPVQGHSAVVLKFYRPGRWSQAQILEEHAFAAELVSQEVPVVAPLALGLVRKAQAAMRPLQIIGGAGLALGYWRDRHLTQERFIAHDHVTDQSFTWGQSTYVRFDPAATVAHIVTVEQAP